MRYYLQGSTDDVSSAHKYFTSELGSETGEFLETCAHLQPLHSNVGFLENTPYSGLVHAASITQNPQRISCLQRSTAEG